MSRPADVFHRRAFAALFMGAFAIGFAPIFMRLSPLGPTATAFWRLALAMPLLWTVFLWPAPARRAKKRSWDGWPWLVSAGIFFTFDLAVWHWAVNLTTVANSTLLANGAPIFVTFFAWLLFREKITFHFIVGLAAAILGGALLVGGNLHLSEKTLLGDGLSILTAMFYGSYQLSVKNARAYFPTATIMAVSGLISCVLLAGVAAVSGESFLWDHVPQWPGWFYLLALAIFAHAGGQGCIAYALAHLPASFSSVTLLIQPFVATIAAWAIFSERLGVWQLVGGAVILAGITLAQRGTFRKQGTANTGYQEAP